MSLNPYESPRTEEQPAPAGERSLRPWPLGVAILWIALLVLGIPAVQHIPIVLRLACTLLTMGVYGLLIYAVRRLWHWALTIPVWIVLGIMLYMVWTFPGAGR